MGKIYKSVRCEYYLRTELGARRHDVACLVHATFFFTFWLRIHPQYVWLRALYIHVHPRAKNALPPRVFVLKYPPVTCSACVLRASSLRCPCLHGTSSFQLPKHVRTDQHWRHLQRTVCTLTNTQQWASG